MRPLPIAALALALAAAATVAACGGGGGDKTLGPDGAVAITVGAAKITNGDIERRATFLATAPDQTQTQTDTGPPAKDSSGFREFRRQAAEQLRDEKAVGILAARCGKPCAVTAKETADQITTLTQQQFGGNTTALERALRERGITRADLERSLRAAQQEQLLAAREEAKVRYTDAEALAYYRKNIAQYKLRAEKRVSHILVATKAQALAIRAEATAANFAELARQRSIDEQAKTTGGDLGPVTGGGLLPELAAVVQKLKPGQISQPVQSQFGWHLLLVRDIKARTKTFAEVRGDIIVQETQVKRAAAVQRWRDTVLKKEQDAAKYLNAKVAPATPATGTAATTGTATGGTATATTSTGATTVTAPSVPVTPTSPVTP